MLPMDLLTHGPTDKPTDWMPFYPFFSQLPGITETKKEYTLHQDDVYSRIPLFTEKQS